MNYMDYFGLNEEDTNEATDQEVKNEKEILNLKKQQAAIKEDEAPEHIEKLIDAAEAAYDAGMSIDEIMSMIEQHLGLKMGDF